MFPLTAAPISRRRFVALAGCSLATAIAVASFGPAVKSAQASVLGDMLKRLGLDGSSDGFNSDQDNAAGGEDALLKVREAFFEQILSDRGDIKLYDWQDRNSGAYGYGGAEFPVGSLYPHAIYVGALDESGDERLMYLAAHQDQGTMLGCRLKIFHYVGADNGDLGSDNALRMVFSSPTWPGAASGATWQQQVDELGLWETPSCAWDALDPETGSEINSFEVFTSKAGTGMYARFGHFRSTDMAYQTTFIHIAYDQAAETYMQDVEPWVSIENPMRYYHGATEVDEQTYQAGTQAFFDDCDRYIFHNGSGSEFLDYRSADEFGMLAGSFGVALSRLGRQIGKTAVFAGEGVGSGANGVEVIDHDFIDLIEDRPVSMYQPLLAHILASLASAAYNEENVIDSLVAMGCTTDIRVINYYEDPYDPAYGPDQVGYAVGIGQTDDGEPLVVVAIRGTYGPIQIPLPPDWSSDFNIGLGSTFVHEGLHQGFATAESEIFEWLCDGEFQDILEQDPTIVVCGHSRGAAVGNILGHQLLGNMEISPNKVWCYNFSCPDSARYADYDWEGQGTYNNGKIFNISDATDPISWVPGNVGNMLEGSTSLLSLLDPYGGTSWDDITADWGKFGSSYWFSGEDYHDQHVDESKSYMDFFDGHMPANVLVYLRTYPKLDEFFDRSVAWSRCGRVASSALKTVLTTIA